MEEDNPCASTDHAAERADADNFDQMNLFSYRLPSDTPTLWCNNTHRPTLAWPGVTQAKEGFGRSPVSSAILDFLELMSKRAPRKASCILDLSPLQNERTKGTTSPEVYVHLILPRTRNRTVASLVLEGACSLVTDKKKQGGTGLSFFP